MKLLFDENLSLLRIQQFQVEIVALRVLGLSNW